MRSFVWALSGLAVAAAIRAGQDDGPPAGTLDTDKTAGLIPGVNTPGPPKNNTKYPPKRANVGPWEAFGNPDIAALEPKLLDHFGVTGDTEAVAAAPPPPPPPPPPADPFVEPPHVEPPKVNPHQELNPNIFKNPDAYPLSGETRTLVERMPWFESPFTRGKLGFVVDVLNDPVQEDKPYYKPEKAPSPYMPTMAERKAKEILFKGNYTDDFKMTHVQQRFWARAVLNGTSYVWERPNFVRAPKCNKTTGEEVCIDRICACYPKDLWEPPMPTPVPSPPTFPALKDECHPSSGCPSGDQCCCPMFGPMGPASAPYKNICMLRSECRFACEFATPTPTPVPESETAGTSSAVSEPQPSHLIPPTDQIEYDPFTPPVEYQGITRASPEELKALLDELAAEGEEPEFNATNLTNLTNATNLTDTNATDYDLNGTDLNGTDLNGTDLNGTNMTEDDANVTFTNLVMQQPIPVKRQPLFVPPNLEDHDRYANEHGNHPEEEHFVVMAGMPKRPVAEAFLKESRVRTGERMDAQPPRIINRIR